MALQPAERVLEEWEQAWVVEALAELVVVVQTVAAGLLPVFVGQMVVGKVFAEGRLVVRIAVGEVFAVAAFVHQVVQIAVGEVFAARSAVRIVVGEVFAARSVVRIVKFDPRRMFVVFVECMQFVDLQIAEAERMGFVEHLEGKHHILVANRLFAHNSWLLLRILVEELAATSVVAHTKGVPHHNHIG